MDEFHSLIEDLMVSLVVLICQGRKSGENGRRRSHLVIAELWGFIAHTVSKDCIELMRTQGGSEVYFLFVLCDHDYYSVTRAPQGPLEAV
jgi:hypothetical protein